MNISRQSETEGIKQHTAKLPQSSNRCRITALSEKMQENKTISDSLYFLRNSSTRNYKQLMCVKIMASQKWSFLQCSSKNVASCVEQHKKCNLH